MKTLLVLAQHPDLAEAVRAGLNPEQYRVIHRASLEEAEPLLVHGLADVCVLDVELSNVQGLWALEKLRRRAPKCPVIIYAGAKEWEWEEEAYLQGATHVLNKPVRARMLSALLERLWLTPAARPAPFPSPLSPSEAGKLPEAGLAAAAGAGQPLGILRNFSSILTHSLDAEGMLKQFLLLLREILSINRAAIFLPAPLAPSGAASGLEDHRQLRAACSVGLSSGLLHHFELSFEAGIGGHLFRQGRILRRFSDETRNDLETQKEFELLGAQVAVPILDRESVVGVAVFDGRVTGEPLMNSELQLIFHLLEQLGLAIKNIWLHDQLASNHEMMAGILRELNSACVVVGRDLAILHANKMARRYFGRAERRGAEMEFSDLPAVLGAKIYQVLKTGSAISQFRYMPESSPGSVYNVNIVPFQRQQTGGLPASALLMAEDLTQSEQLHRLELEAAGLRQLKAMAERLTHELGNAMVPLSVHQQMFEETLPKGTIDLEFLKTLAHDWGDGLKRANRLIQQIRFLARDTLPDQDAFPLAPVVQEAYVEACKHQPAKSAELSFENGCQPAIVTGDREALKHALSEVMLNALQANPEAPKVGIRLRAESNGSGVGALEIEVQDNGAGFSSEAAQKAFNPFFTTRTVGLGLGLTVSRKIIETHRGKMEIVSPAASQPRVGIVRISLPVEPAPYTPG